MTTVAYKSGVMACDSAWTGCGGDAVVTLLNKITRLSSGALIGEAGDNDSRVVRTLLDKIKCFDKMPTAQDLANTRTDYHAIIAFMNGEVAEVLIEYCDTAKEWRGQTYKINRGIAAVGSGSHLALGFMGAGRSANEAVNFACAWDRNSQLPVHMVHLRQKPTVKRKLKLVVSRA